MASAAPKFSGKVNTVTPVKQRFSLWCWAACCEMFAKYHGFNSYNQNEYVLLALKGLPKDESDTGSLYNSAAEPTDFVKILQKGLPKAKAVKYTGTDALRYSHDAIKKFIDDGRIMIVGAGSHARVLCGYGTFGGKEVLAVVDPAIGATAVFQWLDFDSCSWIVYVSKT